jgi:hypothetical protein
MTYWDTFKAPNNPQLFAEHGFPPGDGGVSPEFVLDVTNSVLSPYGLPVWPIGDGSSKNSDEWKSFVSHARDLSMQSVSVWRHGITDENVWRVFKEMPPDLGSVEKPGLKKGRTARVVNTGFCLTLYSKLGEFRRRSLPDRQ